MADSKTELKDQTGVSLSDGAVKAGLSATAKKVCVGVSVVVALALGTLFGKFVLSDNTSYISGSTTVAESQLSPLQI